MPRLTKSTPLTIVFIVFLGGLLWISISGLVSSRSEPSAQTTNPQVDSPTEPQADPIMVEQPQLPDEKDDASPIESLALARQIVEREYKPIAVTEKVGAVSDELSTAAARVVEQLPEPNDPTVLANNIHTQQAQIYAQQRQEVENNVMQETGILPHEVETLMNAQD